MRQYYIKKLIKYATEGKIEIKVKSLGCVDSFVYKMYVKDISNETIQSFNISSEDIKNDWINIKNRKYKKYNF